jgi:hypothetical protein
MIAELFMTSAGAEKRRTFIDLRRSDDGDCPIGIASRGIMNEAMLNLSHDPIVKESHDGE